jgi:hypothetical protein
MPLITPACLTPESGDRRRHLRQMRDAYAGSGRQRELVDVFRHVDFELDRYGFDESSVPGIEALHAVVRSPAITRIGTSLDVNNYFWQINRSCMTRSWACN